MFDAENTSLGRLADMVLDRRTSRLGDPSPALSDRVADALRAEIESGRWAVGERIPTENELVEWTGSGRNTVREAVGSLVRSGMLRRQQGRGTFVTADSDLQSTLSRHAAANSRRDILELRLALDSAAARLAAIRHTPADAGHLNQLLEARDEAWRTGTLADRKQTDTALHRAVLSASHNILLEQVYSGLIDVFEEALDDDVAGDNDQLRGAHHELIAAIVDGRAADAERQMSLLLQPLIDSVPAE